MKTRVKPYEYDRYANSRRWAVQVFDPNIRGATGAHGVAMGEWVTNSEHRFLWFASWKANRFAQYSLATRQNGKEKFVERLQDGDGTGVANDA